MKLTKNVTKDHVVEIFGNFGSISHCEFPMDKDKNWMNSGRAYVEYEKVEEADEAIKKMDGGKRLLRICTVENTLYKLRKFTLTQF